MMIRNVPFTNPKLRNPDRIQKFAKARDVLTTVERVAAKLGEKDQSYYDLDPTPGAVTVHNLQDRGRFDLVSGNVERNSDEEVTFMSVQARDFGINRGSFYSEAALTLDNQGERTVYKFKRGQETHEVYHDHQGGLLTYFTRDAKGRFQ